MDSNLSVQPNIYFSIKLGFMNSRVMLDNSLYNKRSNIQILMLLSMIVDNIFLLLILWTHVLSSLSDKQMKLLTSLLSGWPVKNG